MYECPVLLFTAEVREWLQWFELTHQLRSGPGWTFWQRTALPAAGGVEDQPALLMEAISLIAREENAWLAQAAKGRRRADGDGKRRRRRG